ncbi:hypothetical protein ACH436_13290 [Isoptericola sp. NPDC019693]|uniref:hypothetical protein n=1 Tax=Isoptericola sp. NPDC019693 TaxID=3364009 RepID=UPI0037B6ECEF
MFDDATSPGGTSGSAASEADAGAARPSAPAAKVNERATPATPLIRELLVRELRIRELLIRELRLDDAQAPHLVVLVTLSVVWKHPPHQVCGHLFTPWQHPQERIFR